MVYSSLFLKALIALNTISSVVNAQPVCSRSEVKARGGLNPFTLNEKSTLDDYLRQNAFWADHMKQAHPTLFDINGKSQHPHTLWIGCADSRVNENALNIVPGEVFGLRSIANVVNTNDILAMATLEYGIHHLNIKKIVIAGHTSCGGIEASLNHTNLGPELAEVTKHIEPINKIRDQYITEINALRTPQEKSTRLAKLNVIAQLKTLKSLEVVRAAMEKDGLQVWGFLYHVESGRLEPVNDQTTAR